MVAPVATVLFQPGWKHRAPGEEMHDPDTGEAFDSEPTETVGKGLVQQKLWTGMVETTSTGVVDERVVMFYPVVYVGADHEFISPTGEVWQAMAEGIPRGIPGHAPEYVAVLCRRAKEKDAR